MVYEPRANRRLFVRLVHVFKRWGLLPPYNPNRYYAANRNKILRTAWPLHIFDAMSRKEECTHISPVYRYITCRGHSGVYRERCVRWYTSPPTTTPQKGGGTKRTTQNHRGMLFLSQYTSAIHGISRTHTHTYIDIYNPPSYLAFSGLSSVGHHLCGKRHFLGFIDPFISYVGTNRCRSIHRAWISSKTS